MDTDSSLTFNFSHVAHEESVSRLKNNAKQKQSTVDKKNQNAKRMLFISDSDDQIDGVEGHYFTFEDVLSIFGGTYLTVNYGQERKNTNRDDTLNSWTVGGSYCCWIGLCFVDCCIQMALTFETHD